MIETQQIEHRSHDPWFWEGRAIPISEVLYLFNILPYANGIRVGLQLLFYTGCRLSELTQMRRSELIDGVIYWKLGKNQTHKAHRRERLPDAFMEELKLYWKTHRMPENRVYHATGSSLARRLNAEIRPLLREQWRDKVRTLRKSGFTWEYVYQLKGFRKIFATLIFVHYYTKFNDAYVAGEMTAKRMMHSDSGLTWHHYILCAEQIDAKKYMHLLPFEISGTSAQRTVMDFI